MLLFFILTMHLLCMLKFKCSFNFESRLCSISTKFSVSLLALFVLTVLVWIINFCMHFGTFVLVFKVSNIVMVIYHNFYHFI